MEGGQREQRSWATAGRTGRPGELIIVTFGSVRMSSLHSLMSC